MKNTRPQKRSVSPFGSVVTMDDPFAQLQEAISKVFPANATEKKLQLKSIDDAGSLPSIIREISEAPANDAPMLDAVCQFLLLFRETLNERGIGLQLFDAMRQLFDRKTEMFMIDHHDRAHCERMGWAAEYRDVILFSRERDALIGRYFAPITETQPGLFSEFVTHWMETDNPDRILHFLDFCAGSKNPTFEHYLLFTHPALARVISNKAALRALLEKTRPLLTKLSSPTWEQDLHRALGV